MFGWRMAEIDMPLTNAELQANYRARRATERQRMIGALEAIRDRNANATGQMGKDTLALALQGLGAAAKGDAK